ncbi:hypothetical protein BYT27DRAFT_7218362 [Phlegmacium glaucopus]|nr:hypothetical protein BYT27DRAFT_7218362 [Phlegmacium glaucopus]
MSHSNSNSNSYPNFYTSPWSQPHTNQQPPPLPQFFSPTVLGAHANTMPLGAQPFHSWPFWFGPLYQGTTEQYQDQPPSAGPSRNQRGGGHRRTVSTATYQVLHGSSRTIRSDRSAGTYSGMAWMGADNNAGTGRPSRPPSGNPSAKSYNRHRSAASWTRRRMEDISVYEVPLIDLPVGSSMTTGGSNGPAVIPTVSPPAPQPPIPAPAASTSSATSGVSDEDTQTTDAQERSVEDEDYDTVLLGSNTE